MAIQMTCAACGANLSFEDAQLGQSGPCYQCGHTLTVAPTATPPAAPIGQAPIAQPPFGAPGYVPNGGAFGGPGQSGPGGPAPWPTNTTETGSASKEGWSWRYSPYIGIMYGPIPVGIIVVSIVGLIYLATQL